MLEKQIMALSIVGAVIASGGVLVGVWTLLTRRFEIYAHDIDTPRRADACLDEVDKIVTENQVQSGRNQLPSKVQIAEMEISKARTLSRHLTVIAWEYWIFSRNYSELLRRSIAHDVLTEEERAEAHEADRQWTELRHEMKKLFLEAWSLRAKLRFASILNSLGTALSYVQRLLEFANKLKEEAREAHNKSIRLLTISARFCPA